VCVCACVCVIRAVDARETPTTCLRTAVVRCGTCVCVFERECVREGEREKEKERARD